MVLEQTVFCVIRVCQQEQKLMGLLDVEINFDPGKSSIALVRAWVYNVFLSRTFRTEEWKKLIQRLTNQNAKNNITFQKNFVFKQVILQNNLLVFFVSRFSRRLCNCGGPINSMNFNFVPFVWVLNVCKLEFVVRSLQMLKLEFSNTSSTLFASLFLEWSQSKKFWKKKKLQKK